MARVLDRGVLSGAGAPEMRGLEAEFAATIGSVAILAIASSKARVCWRAANSCTATVTMRFGFRLIYRLRFRLR